MMGLRREWSRVCRALATFADPCPLSPPLPFGFPTGRGGGAGGCVVGRHFRRGRGWEQAAATWCRACHPLVAVDRRRRGWIKLVGRLVLESFRGSAAQPQRPNWYPPQSCVAFVCFGGWEGGCGDGTIVFSAAGRGVKCCVRQWLLCLSPVLVAWSTIH